MSRSRPRVLITGIAGFSGSHLANWLLEQSQEVIGLDIEGTDTRNLCGILGYIDLRLADIQDVEQISRILADVRPQRIYHLAGITKPAAGRGRQALYEVNVLGTISVLEAVEREVLDCAVLITGSSAQYGMTEPDESPIAETHPFRPVTDYAVSKAAQDLVGYRYWIATSLRVIRTRAFNIIGSRQSPEFVGSAFAKQVAEIERGLREPVIEVGNLEAQRDFVDVRDVVKAYQLALEQGKPGEVYNVCSGQGHSIRSVLDGLLALSTVSGIEIRQDAARLQRSDVPIQVGDYGKLQRQTGWRPRVAFDQSLRDLLDYWRGQD
jgi:GDP-4-dehydro-6-deoxy-D-mannose reductase